MTRTDAHTKDHDHGQCVAGAMSRVEECCARKGLRMTPLRRNVMKALAESHVPLGAYEIVQKLSTAGDPAPPMSVYRVLDFLVAEGLAHRIESRNAFLACPGGHGVHPQAVFMICETCGVVSETVSPQVEAGLMALARDHGFRPKGRVVELTGCCGTCTGTRDLSQSSPHNGNS